MTGVGPPVHGPVLSSSFYHSSTGETLILVSEGKAPEFHPNTKPFLTRDTSIVSSPLPTSGTGTTPIKVLGSKKVPDEPGETAKSMTEYVTTFSPLPHTPITTRETSVVGYSLIATGIGAKATVIGATSLTRHSTT